MDLNLVFGVLHGTPVWVFVLFAYLLLAGFRQLTPGVRELRRLWLVPVLFIVWGLVGLFERSAAPAETASYWLVGAVLGAVLVLPLPMDLKIDRARGLVRQPASILPLVRNLSIFFGHYLLRVATVFHPDSAHQLMNWDTVVSGISVGYFALWSFRFARACARAPEIDLGAAAACAVAVPR